MAFSHGDRVRILKDQSEYTGCRGVVVEKPRGPHGNVSALGNFVAIDGENGKVRPFLLSDLELLRVASVRHSQATPSVESGTLRD
jgi:hypothetical protein